MKIAIVYKPNLAKRFGQQGFSYVKPGGAPLNLPSAPLKAGEGNVSTIAAPQVSTFMDPVEILVLNKGTTFVDKEVWDAVEAHQKGGQKDLLAKMDKEGSLKVFRPDAKNPVGATSDYTDLDVVREIVSGVGDREWLRRSMARDSREAVFTVINERLDEISEDEKQRAQQDEGSWF